MGNLDRSAVFIYGNGIISTLSINFFIEKSLKNYIEKIKKNILLF
jgi:hypothetical protein